MVGVFILIKQLDEISGSNIIYFLKDKRLIIVTNYNTKIFEAIGLIML